MPTNILESLSNERRQIVENWLAQFAQHARKGQATCYEGFTLLAVSDLLSASHYAQSIFELLGVANAREERQATDRKTSG